MMIAIANNLFHDEAISIFVGDDCLDHLWVIRTNPAILVAAKTESELRGNLYDVRLLEIIHLVWLDCMDDRAENIYSQLEVTRLVWRGRNTYAITR